MSRTFLSWLSLAAAAVNAPGQAADWQTVAWREPQVRYLLADMTLGGNVLITRLASNERISGMEVTLSTD
jgi:hypothetical protein